MGEWRKTRLTIALTSSSINPHKELYCSLNEITRVADKGLIPSRKAGSTPVSQYFATAVPQDAFTTAKNSGLRRSASHLISFSLSFKCSLMPKADIKQLLAGASYSSTP